jgi:hypothetical protein
MRLTHRNSDAALEVTEAHDPAHLGSVSVQSARPRVRGELGKSDVSLISLFGECLSLESGPAGYGGSSGRNGDPIWHVFERVTRGQNVPVMNHLTDHFRFLCDIPEHSALL